MRGYNAPMTNIRDYILDGTPDDVVARYESLPELAAKSDFGVLDSNVVVVDTETTGFSFTHDELIQIADYFDVSVDYLLGRTENPKINK